MKKDNMPIIMTENTQNEIRKKMKIKIYKKTKKKIIGLIREKFLNDFKYVCKDNDFIDYILSF